VAAVEVATPCHRAFQLVELCPGGLDFNFSGQEINQDRTDLLVRRREAVTKDAGDVKICVSLQMEINY
jgi:hypothetical protein